MGACMHACMHSRYHGVGLQDAMPQHMHGTCPAACFAATYTYIHHIARNKAIAHDTLGPIHLQSSLCSLSTHLCRLAKEGGPCMLRLATKAAGYH